MNYFNPRHLDAFVTAVDSGSMAKAAAKLHMGQPALSQAIANLERLSGVKLLSRTTRSLLPTAAGEAFYKGAQRVLESNARLLKDVQMWSSAQQGSVCVLSIPSIAQLLRACDFARVECHEDRPVPHGLRSAVRAALWPVLRGAMRLALAIETGESGREAIFSQCLLAVAHK